ncbi:MAG: DUF1697 domain-containing protein [Verrucomicrobiota bacterium]|nr:DUF1697 domain-containing protein [Verrucomicrobiota bacterium]
MRYIAFLRAINVGGHVVKMEQLRAVFRAIGLATVETFIASGNVIFDSETNAKNLESGIEKALEKELGYEVVTFVRLEAELAQIAAYEAFPASEVGKEGSTLFIGFLRSQPKAEARQKLLEFPNAAADFRFHARELHWLCRTRVSDSPFSGAWLEKLLEMRTTVRNVNTVRRLVARLSLRPSLGTP